MRIAIDRDARIIVDLIREVRVPFSPKTVVGEFSNILRDYHITRVRGDRYAGEWPREQFRKRGITYEPSDKPKSEIYRAFLPLINSAKVELLDNQRLASQLSALERRTARGGRDSIDHPPGPGWHDDIANAVCGVVIACTKKGPMQISDSLLAISAIKNYGDPRQQRLHEFRTSISSEIFRGIR